MTDLCAGAGCKRLAEVAPKLIVPRAAELPIDPKMEHAIMLGMKLCRRCALGLKPADFTSQPNIVEFFRRLARAQARRFGLSYFEPDFARARFTRVPLGSSEYRRLAPRLEKPARPADEVDRAPGGGIESAASEPPLVSRPAVR